MLLNPWIIDLLPLRNMTPICFESQGNQKWHAWPKQRLYFLLYVNAALLKTVICHALWLKTPLLCVQILRKCEVPAELYCFNSLIVSSCLFLLVYLFPCGPLQKQSVCTCEHLLCQTSPVFMDFSRISLLHWLQRNFTDWKSGFFFFWLSHLHLFCQVCVERIHGKGRRLFLNC